MKKALILIAVVALTGFGLAACGDDDDDDDTTAAATSTTETAAASSGFAGTPEIDLSAPADGSLAFDQKAATAVAGGGGLTINFNNPASIAHDVAVEDSSGEEIGKTDLVSEGETSTTVDIRQGTYTFFCTVPGHREAGMEGTLTVKP